MTFTVAARQGGVTRTDVAGLLRHSFRDVDRQNGTEARHSNPRIKPELTGLNESRMWDGSVDEWVPISSTDEVLAELDDRLAHAGGTRTNKRTGKTTKVAVRRDAKVVREIVLQLDPEWTRSSAFVLENQEVGDGVHAGEVRARLMDMVTYFGEVYGEDNLLAYSLHLDETSPHVHLFVTPIDDLGRVRQASFIPDGKGAQSGLANVDRGLRRYLIERGFDADPEPRRVRQSNLSVDEYARYAEAAEEVAAREVEVEDRQAALDCRESEAEKRETGLASRATELDAREVAVADAEVAVAARETEVETAEAALPNLRRKAKEESREIVKAASVDAARIRGDARTDASAILATAHADAATIRADAEKEVDRRISEAAEAIERERAAAAREAVPTFDPKIAEAQMPAALMAVLQRVNPRTGRSLYDAAMEQAERSYTQKTLGVLTEHDKQRLSETVAQRKARMRSFIDGSAAAPAPNRGPDYGFGKSSGGGLGGMSP